MRIVSVAVKSLLVALVGFGLAGCRGMKVDYGVEVRNNTSGVIAASVVQDIEDRNVTVGETRVFPKERQQLSLARRARRERLELRVTAPNNPSTPARMPLSPGMTYVNVTREADDGAIRLEPVR